MTEIEFVEKQKARQEAIFDWASAKLFSLPASTRDYICKNVNRIRNENKGATTAFCFILVMHWMYPTEYDAVISAY